MSQKRLNNYNTCEHKKTPDGGYCYMFQTEPRTACMQHTARKIFSDEKALTKLLIDIYDIMKH